MAVGTAIGSEPVRFRVLGPLEVVRSESAVPLGGPRQRAVLALLLLEANRVVSIDRLVEDVWAGRPGPGSVTTLQTYVFHLRQALEPDRVRGAGGGVLVTRDRGYLLRVNREHIDAAVFEQGVAAGRAALDAGRHAEAAQALRDALDLWRGAVLADLADYAFVRPEAVRLEELRLAAVEDRLEADLALGRHQALTGELERLVGEYPLRERLHGQLMLALYRSGRQADALAAYRRVRDLLADELGIDPSEPLQRLHRCVLAHDPALDWNGARPIPTEGHRAEAGTPVAEPIPSHSPATRASRAPGWGGRRARHLLAIGAALAVAAAIGIVAVARPWAGAAGGLPANSVGLIGAAGGRLGGTVTVGNPDGLAYGDGSVWAVDSTDGTVVRINPATHAVVQTIPVGSAPSAVAASGGDVWVANSGSGTVSEINAATNKVVRTVTVGNVPVAITGGHSGVWVANEGDDTVERIDPATGAVSRPVPVGGRPDGIAAGPSGVWVANSEDGTVTKIDPATYQPSGPISVGSGPAGIAVTRAAVWVANSFDLTVSKLDPATGRVTGTVDVGDGPSSIVAAKNAIWVSDEFNATLDRIDPRTDQVATVHLGSSPRGLVAAGTGVWVAARPFSPARHRGGTLTVVSSYLPIRDPARAIDINDAVLGTVYDGLAALRKSGGAAGFSLVPDLATRLPRPADGGTMYTFTLRRGIRYSTGTFVRASDFRRGIARQLSFGANPGYYEGILGGQACHQHPKRCDLSAGIVTSDAARTVTFHLTRPDPDFLYKLALTLAVPAPRGSPSHVINQAPFLPGTGPYKISQYRPGASFTVVRNPYFRQWSYAAQPAGYPDVIRYKQMADPLNSQHLVASGKADLVDLLTDGPLNMPLALRYPTRIHPGIKVFTQYVVLNTRVPPFTSIKARQAINYAIDRAKIIRLEEGPGEAAPTCQILPADFPGHRNYCPYTAGRNNGAWHSPDMAKAKQLVKASGTTHVPVTVWSFNGGPDKAVGSYLVRLLKHLGYRANLHAAPNPPFSNAHRKIQMGWFGIWGPDFPSPSTFFLPLLTCHSFYSDPANTLNWSGFCDPHVDELARHAQAEQLTDPARARTLWAQVDRMVTDQAPWAPFLNIGPTVFVSARVRNYQASPEYGPLLDQIWIR